MPDLDLDGDVLRACEGEPGARTDNFYGAYFRDLDGNKLNVFCMTQGG